MVVAAAAGRRAEVSNHVRFFRMHLKMLPQPYLSLDTSRMTALYFCVVGLDILGELEREVKEAERLALIEWIYGLQVLDEAHGGFRGSGWAGETRHVDMFTHALFSLRLSGRQAAQSRAVPIVPCTRLRRLGYEGASADVKFVEVWRSERVVAASWRRPGGTGARVQSACMGFLEEPFWGEGE